MGSKKCDLAIKKRRPNRQSRISPRSDKVFLGPGESRARPRKKPAPHRFGPIREWVWNFQSDARSVFQVTRDQSDPPSRHGGKSRERGRFLHEKFEMRKFLGRASCDGSRGARLGTPSMREGAGVRRRCASEGRLVGGASGAQRIMPGVQHGAHWGAGQLRVDAWSNLPACGVLEGSRGHAPGPARARVPRFSVLTGARPLWIARCLRTG